MEEAQQHLQSSVLGIANAGDIGDNCQQLVLSYLPKVVMIALDAPWSAENGIFLGSGTPGTSAGESNEQGMAPGESDGPASAWLEAL